MPEHVTLNVGRDLDGCDYDFAAAYVMSCHTLGINLPDGVLTLDGHPLFKAARWEFYEDLGHSLPHFLANCNRAADEGLLWNRAPLRGVEAWHDIARHGHRIHVKTDRAFGSSPLASQVGTRIALRQWGTPFDSITFGPDKTAGPEVDIMLEDRLSNYDALDATGVQVWLFDRPWNQDPGDTRRRVYSHDEFATRVGALARRYALVGA